MCALFRDPAVLQQNDPVAETGAGKAVRNEEGSHTLRHFVVFPVNIIFRDRIKGRRRFIQDQHSTAFIKRLGKHRLLLLPSRQLRGVFSGRPLQAGIRSRRQASYLLADSRLFQTPRHSLSVRFAPDMGRHILCDAHRQKLDILEHHRQPGEIRLITVPRDVLSVQKNPAAARPVKPTKQLHQRSLAGAVSAHDGHLLPGPDREGDVPQRILLRPLITKTHMLESQRRRARSSRIPGRPITYRFGIYFFMVYLFRSLLRRLPRLPQIQPGKIIVQIKPQTFQFPGIPDQAPHPDGQPGRHTGHQHQISNQNPPGHRQMDQVIIGNKISDKRQQTLPAAHQRPYVRDPVRTPFPAFHTALVQSGKQSRHIVKPQLSCRLQGLPLIFQIIHLPVAVHKRFLLPLFAPPEQHGSQITAAGCYRHHRQDRRIAPADGQPVEKKPAQVDQKRNAPQHHRLAKGIYRVQCPLSDPLPCRSFYICIRRGQRLFIHRR